MHLTNSTVLGIGDPQARLRVYIGNRPNTVIEHATPGITPLVAGNICRIGQDCGNGWRKVFNVFAKLAYALPSPASFRQGHPRWQAFRDNSLLQANSDCALMFSEPKEFSKDAIHIISGKTFANTLHIAPSLHWITPDFAIDAQRHVVVCPYFDYRQLSNSKILFLVELLAEYQYLPRLSGK
ncbi:DUF6942 family protein [Alteromonas gilva]|uniref:Uncharacterized protein n=1 Tax=Alteromonas gilva TaxID=2987522 RepID=A0ABT5KZ14_9ALTE|nr:hypothetical protein [Alteromonas gilva]MDC8829496.1 hypothetical protein [Alteromonas gilva]